MELNARKLRWIMGIERFARNLRALSPERVEVLVTYEDTPGPMARPIHFAGEELQVTDRILELTRRSRTVVHLRIQLRDLRWRDTLRQIRLWIRRRPQRLSIDLTVEANQVVAIRYRDARCLGPSGPWRDFDLRNLDQAFGEVGNIAITAVGYWLFRTGELES